MAGAKSKSKKRKTSSKKNTLFFGKKSKRKKKSKKGSIPFGMKLFACVCFILLLGFILKKPLLLKYYSFKLSAPVEAKQNEIKENVLIDGKSYRGKSKEKVIAELERNKDKNISDTADAVILVSSDGSKNYTFKMSDFDVKYDIENAVESAFSFATDSKDSGWMRQFKALERGTVNFETLVYSKEKVETNINNIAEQIYVKAADASESPIDGKMVITPSKTGFEIDSSLLTKQILDNLDAHNFGQTITFDIKVTEPKIKTEDFEGADKLIGSYSSPYSSGDSNRNQNLKNACEKINGVILYPGEEFSTNEHFNPCTEENGWANAGTIVDGQIEDSIGGGMCQVSTALYDAVLKAELEVTQRYNHSMKVSYAPYAFDATLAGDYKDLKFKNSTSKPLYIQAMLENGSVNVNLYGEEIHPEGRTVKLRNEYVESTEPDGPITKNDPDMYVGETRTVSAMNGLTYELYRDIYENGELVKSEKVNTSYYSPRRETKYIGVKPRNSD